MARSMSKITLVLLVSAVVACVLGMFALMPESAHAVQSHETLLTTQAGTQTSLYVRGSIDDKKYTYNKNGLITKIIDKNSQWKLKYKGDKVVKIVHARKNIVDGTWNNDIEYSIAYDTKDRVKSMTVLSEGMPADIYNNTETYTYNKKNQITKRVITYTSGSPKSTVKYYYNSKGLLKKIDSPNGVELFKYDSKGNRIKYSFDSSDSTISDRKTTYAYTYKNGRITKITQTDGGYSYDKKIKYVKKTIPKKYASVVKAQQKAVFGFLPGVFLSQIA